MIAPTPEQQIFMQDDVSTRLHHLAAHLSQIQYLWTQTSSQDLMMPLVKESRYFLEWTVPDMVRNPMPEGRGLKKPTSDQIKS
ncbi:hypothetical protein [Nodularia sp. NIES-3585]|uniref:hypothetical protein n=1 Tax=Nodularia sp. NIES-3585 TaxID=1973477 RepID=UPI000B712D78|nr:hypothetical protein [Nodularia sp. NIES-3585]GAX38875.1 hypothetical protein NIES3585_49270 [Nodularia sp. NIES-3585]